LVPKPRERARVDDRQVLSGIIHVQRNGLMWKDAPAVYGRLKTLYNRWKRWSRMGVFAHILLELAATSEDTEPLMSDATHLKAHRTAASLQDQKGASERNAAG
jgi:transposase